MAVEGERRNGGEADVLYQHLGGVGTAIIAAIMLVVVLGPLGLDGVLAVALFAIASTAVALVLFFIRPQGNNGAHGGASHGSHH
jgi:hypothetical protein